MIFNYAIYPCVLGGYWGHGNIDVTIIRCIITIIIYITITVIKYIDLLLLLLDTRPHEDGGN